MRLDIDTYREIADSLVRNRSRSLLTGFGIFWGLFMLLALIGGGQGLKSMLLKNFEGFATNTAIVWESATTKPCKGFKEGRRWHMSYKDVERLRKIVPELETVTPVLSEWGITAEYGTSTASCSLKGVYADYANIESPKLKYGRYINSTDVLLERKVCVIGKRIYTSLFPEGGDPCGSFIKFGTAYYQVIGVDFNSGNISINGNADQAATVPLPVIQKIYNRGSYIDIICLTGKKGIRMSSLEERIRQILAREHYFDPTDKQALFYLNTEQVFSIMDNLFKGVNFLIWLVGLGTILAGAIGVSNIMMVTVKERTTEIGIRRAIGATPKDILSQIIMESISLTLMAGSAGIVFSVLVLQTVEKITKQSTFQINFWTAIAAAALLALLGVVAGLAPAVRAMQIKPVDAMRDE